MERAEGPIEDVELRGHRARRRRRDAVLQAIAEADAIVIGPSNPVISIGPILALPGMREALRAAPAPVVAVSPFVGGRVGEGADRAVLRARRASPRAPAGIARAYADVIDGRRGRRGGPDLAAAPVTDTLMDGAEDARRGSRARCSPSQHRVRALTVRWRPRPQRSPSSP